MRAEWNETVYRASPSNAVTFINFMRNVMLLHIYITIEVLYIVYYIT